MAFQAETGACIRLRLCHLLSLGRRLQCEGCQGVLERRGAELLWGRQAAPPQLHRPGPRALWRPPADKPVSPAFPGWAALRAALPRFLVPAGSPSASPVLRAPMCSSLSPVGKAPAKREAASQPGRLCPAPGITQRFLRGGSWGALPWHPVYSLTKVRAAASGRAVVCLFVLRFIYFI